MNPMTFIRNVWYAASWVQDLEAGKPTAVTILDQPIVLFRTAGGAAAALSDSCGHRNAPLSRGRCENGLIRCMYHGLVFDESGHCVEVPGQRNIPAACHVPNYPTAERGDFVWVWLGNPAVADPDLIPLPAGLDTADWAMRRSHCSLDAHYMLMNDNLADMSHVAYLHEATFGGGDTRIAQTHPKITTIDRGIRVERWLSDREIVEDWLPDSSRAPSGSMQDIWLSYDLMAPGVFVMRTELHPAGVARSSGYSTPSQRPLHSNLNIQAVTPVSSTRSRHFFALGPPSSETIFDETLPDVMFQIMQRGFEEDRCMLEAQQQNLTRRPINPSAAIRHDRGVLLLREIIGRLIALEDRDAPDTPESVAGEICTSPADARSSLMGADFA